MLTSTDARAIRTADALCFDQNPDGTGVIRAVFRAKDLIGGGRTTEYTVEVPVLSRVNNYGPGDGPWVCFAMVMSAQYDDRAQTFVRRMKAGTKIALIWTRDNASLVTREAGLYVDALDMKVQNGLVCDTYRVANFVGLDNTARMTQIAGYK